MNNKIIIGTRGSKLSLAYANLVKDLIISKMSPDTPNIILKKITTSGDLSKEKKISELGGKNIFCKELENELIENKIDIAIHSLKDLDSFEPPGLLIGAYIKRNDPRDTIVLKKKSNFRTHSMVIGSSSRRRDLQIKILNKKIIVKPIRGNVDSRIKKVESGEYDGAILALAGLKFLNIKNSKYEILSENELIPAVGQGTIAVQCNQNNSKIKKILKKINHNDTEICSIAEKSFLREIGGDCHTAVGGLAKIKKDKISLKVQLFSDDGNEVYNFADEGEKKEPKILGKLVGRKILELSKGKYIKKR